MEVYDVRVNARPTFRLATPAERSALEDLQRRASLIWEEDRDALLAHPDAIELPLEQITDGRTIVAESVGELIGFAVVLPREDGDAELDGLFVEPTHWRHGIGRALVDEVERMALADGAASLWVTANTRALGFYDSCGFVTVGEVATRFRPAPKMRKTLDVAR
jgi:GNAT superfamily N-acetyltransferase